MSQLFVYDFNISLFASLIRNTALTLYVNLNTLFGALSLLLIASGYVDKTLSSTKRYLKRGDVQRIYLAIMYL